MGVSLGMVWSMAGGRNRAVTRAFDYRDLTRFKVSQRRFKGVAKAIMGKNGPPIRLFHTTFNP